MFEVPAAVGLEPVGEARQGTEVAQVGLRVDAGLVGDGVVGLAGAGRAGSPREDVDGVAFFEDAAHLVGDLVAIDGREAGVDDDRADGDLAAGEDRPELGEQHVPPPGEVGGAVARVGQVGAVEAHEVLSDGLCKRSFYRKEP